MPDLNEIASLINAGKKDQARQQLMGMLSSNPNNDQAWVYMAAVAKNKTEFEESVRRALDLNPINNQALQLAEKYDLPIPMAVVPAAKARPAARRRGWLRSCLILIVLWALVGGAVWFFLLRDTGGSKPAGQTGEAGTAEIADAGTQEAVLDETSEPDDIATEEAAATQEVAASGTDEPVTTPRSTAESIEESTPAPAATAESGGATPALSVQKFVTSVEIRAGTGRLADDLEQRSTFYTEDTLNIVVELTDHDQDLNLEAMLVHASGAEPVQITGEAPAGAERTVVMPADPGAGGWSEGSWTAVLTINGEEVETLQFEVEPQPTPTPTAAPSPTPTITPTPLPDPEIMLLYDDNSMTLLNISEEEQNVNSLRFVQQTDRGEFIFEARQWQQMSSISTGSTFGLEPEHCFQIGVNRASAGLLPESCSAITWWLPVPQNDWIWIQATGGSPTFDVFYGEELLATCEIAAMTCSFALPDAE